ncbi:uracil-DNA glycosylase family protein [Agrobacterium sp. 22094]|uniref:uracil-DNA glycosylase family protein n=1 Tax=Agrobacterium sp. 22094 TaxID=3453872 RepID=UPI000DD9840B
MTYRGPDTLWHEHRREKRLAALDSAHMQPLNAFREHLQLNSDRDMPNFDPYDGGISARLLILLETPGPSPVERGRRFVSIDNPTGTAENLRTALTGAGISRRDIVLWNTVPWVRATRGSIVASERREGIMGLAGLLPLLPNLRVAILAGAVASGAEGVLVDAGIEVILCPHPSPTLINTSPTLRDRLHAAFEAAAAKLDQSKTAIEIS